MRINDGKAEISDVKVQLGDLQASASGFVDHLFKPRLLDLSVQTSGTHLSTLAAISGLESLAGLTQDFELLGEVHYSKRTLIIHSLQTRVGQIEARVAGQINRPLDPRSFDLIMSLDGPDLSIARQWIDQQLPAERFSVSVHASGSQDDIVLQELDASLGASDVSGELRVHIGKPSLISGQLHSKNLDLSWLLRDKESVDEEQGAEAADEVQPTGEWAIKDVPIARVGDQGLDVDLDYSADAIDIGPKTFSDAVLGIELSSHRLSINPLQIRDGEASVVGSVMLDGTRGIPHLKALLDWENIRFGIAAAKDEPIEHYPPASIHVDLLGDGVTYHELAASLNGKVRVVYGSGIVANSGLSFIGSDLVLELFSVLNPFSKSSPTMELECGIFAADFVDGAVALAPLLIRTSDILITSEGTVDLNSEKINLSFRTKPRKGLGLSAGAVVNPFIKVGGSLSSPLIELDPAGVVVSGGTAVATVGLSILAKSFSDRFLSSRDPCGDTLKELAKRDAETEQGNGELP